MIQRPLCLRLISLTGFYERRERGISGPIRSSIEPKLRVIFRTPNWEDFVHLAFTEIRFYGAENMQIARRLSAMIVNLTDVLPAQRHTALAKELELLDRAIERLYVLSEDLKLARIPDSQGLGGSSHSEGLS